jgi:hypothetical protein
MVPPGAGATWAFTGRGMSFPDAGRVFAGCQANRRVTPFSPCAGSAFHAAVLSRSDGWHGLASALRLQAIDLSQRLALISLALPRSDRLTAEQLAVAAWSTYHTSTPSASHGPGYARDNAAGRVLRAGSADRGVVPDPAGPDAGVIPGAGRPAAAQVRGRHGEPRGLGAAMRSPGCGRPAGARPAVLPGRPLHRCARKVILRRGKLWLPGEWRYSSGSAHPETDAASRFSQRWEDSAFAILAGDDPGCSGRSKPRIAPGIIILNWVAPMAARFPGLVLAVNPEQVAGAALWKGDRGGG